MIHGKTKIELYDVKRNIKQIIKSENTFQNNVLADYFRHFGEEGCDPFRAGNYDGTDLWKNALGGIFLLKNPETVGNKFMSLGNVMIGNGAYGVSNSGSPNELGSYNSQESSESGTEITQVYDFATNQANGNIACVCLTSKVGGYIGYGNKDGQYHSSRTYNFQSLQNTRGVINCNRASAYGNYIYNVSGNYSDGKLKITKTRRSLITGSVFNGFSSTLEFDLQTVGDGYGISGNTYSFGTLKMYDMGNGIFRFVPFLGDYIYINANSTVYYYEFDAENETLTQKSFINSSGKKLCICSFYGQDTIGVAFIGNYALCNYNEYIAKKLEVINVNTNEYWDELDADAITGLTRADFRRATAFILDNGWVAFQMDIQNARPPYMYDIVNKTVYPINMGEVKNGIYNIGLVSNPSLGSGIIDKVDIEPSQTRTKGIIHNPLYLATINNLDSYITKTANQTMKVTYTLTEE